MHSPDTSRDATYGDVVGMMRLTGEQANRFSNSTDHELPLTSRANVTGDGLPPRRFSGQKPRPRENKLLSALRRFAGK
jgi:hypothetical protein